jgi:4-amino-4-deoxychorismate lyase
MKSPVLHLVNGIPTGLVSVNDRGLRYGDGCFETMAIHNGRVPLWQRHMERLFDGCRRLAIRCEFDAGDLSREAAMLIGEQPRGVLRLTVTRGSGGRGYAPDPAESANRIMSLLPARQYPESYAADGVSVLLCKTPVTSNPLLAGIKHLNRLEQVLARNEWVNEYAEGLMSDQQGNVIEGTITNLFLVHNDEVITPGLEQCGVAGVMRAEIIQRMSRLGFSVSEKNIRIDMLKECQEGFLSNAVIGVWPIASIDGREYSIGSTTRIVQQEIKTIFPVND